MGRMSLFSGPGSVLMKTTLVKSLQRRCSQHTDLAGSQRDTQTIEFPRAYTSGKAYSNLVLQATLPGAKKPPCVASAFLLI